MQISNIIGCAQLPKALSLDFGGMGQSHVSCFRRLGKKSQATINSKHYRLNYPAVKNLKLQSYTNCRYILPLEIKIDTLLSTVLVLWQDTTTNSAHDTVRSEAYTNI